MAPSPQLKKHRLRPGARLFLLTCLAVLVGWFLAWLFGLAPSPKGSPSSSPGAKVTRASFQQRQGSGNRARALPLIRPAISLPPSSSFRVSNNAPSRDSNAPGGFLSLESGPLWLAAELPPPLSASHLVRLRVISCLQPLASGPLQQYTADLQEGAFSLECPAPVGPVYLEVEARHHVALFGPFRFQPWTFHDLGKLTLPPLFRKDGSIQDTAETQGFLVTADPIAGLLSFPILPSREGKPDLRDRGARMWRPSGTPTLYGPWRILWPSPFGAGRDSVNTETKTLTLRGLEPGDVLVRRPAAARWGWVVSPHDSTLDCSSWKPGDKLFLLRPGDRPRAIPWPVPMDSGINLPNAGYLARHGPGAQSFLPLHEDLSPEETSSLLLRWFILHLHAGRGTLAMNPGRYFMVPVEGFLNESVGRQYSIEIREDRRSHWQSPEDVPEAPVPTIHGVVTSAEDGQPLAGAGVLVGRTLPRPGQNASWRAVTDDGGRFTLKHLPQGPLKLRIQSATHLSHESIIPAGKHHEASNPLRVALQRAPPCTIEVACDEKGRPVVDGFVLVNRSGAVVGSTCTGRSLQFPGLAPGRYLALPFLGRMSLPVDDWTWLVKHSGGLLFEQGTSQGGTLRWSSPPPRSLVLRLRVTGHDDSAVQLRLVHTGQPLFPGIWPDLVFENVPPKLVKIDRILPGRYRAILTAGKRSSLCSFTVTDDRTVPMPLHFDLSEEQP